MKLNKIICIFCAVLILVITCANISISASAEEWTDWAAAPTAARQLAQAYLEAWSTNDDKDIAHYFADYADIPISWLKASSAFNGGYILSPVDDIIYYLDENGYLCKEITRGGAGGRSRVGSSKDITVDSDTFSDILFNLNSQYRPTTKNYISMHSDKRWTDLDENVHYNLSFYNEGIFCNNPNWTSVYILPFFYNGVEHKYYFGITQAHLWQEVSYVDGTNFITMYYELTSASDDSYTYTGTINSGSTSDPVNFAVYRYMDINLKLSTTARYADFLLYPSYNDYLNKKINLFNYSGRFSWDSVYNFDYVYVSDTYSTFDINHFDIYTLKSRVAPSTSSVYNISHDIGYLVSNEPIEIKVNSTGIDEDQIGLDMTITFDGDTINDYTITNSTGDSTTLNEYVTNNYTINVNTGGSSGSGTASGNVTVGGNVGVSGEIGVGGNVDINVNVSTENKPSDPFVPVEVDVDNWIEHIPEQGASAFNLVSRFFQFLPPVLFNLLCMGVVVAIILRIWGR